MGFGLVVLLTPCTYGEDEGHAPVQNPTMTMAWQNMQMARARPLPHPVRVQESVHPAMAQHFTNLAKAQQFLQPGRVWQYVQQARSRQLMQPTAARGAGRGESRESSSADREEKKTKAGGSRGKAA